MAHPKLTGRVNRRVALVAGAASLIGLPAAAHAQTLDAVDDHGLGGVLECVAVACEEQSAIVPQQPAGLVPEATSALPEPAKTIVDPITSVVDDVVRSVPSVEGTAGAVERVPALVEDVVRSVEPAAPGTTAPVGPAQAQPPAAVGTAGDPPGTAVGPRQGPPSVTTPFTFTPSTAASSRADTASTRPFLAPPVITAPFAADLPRIAEEFVSRTPVSAGVDALRGVQDSTLPGPDGPSWLLATAGGLLLLVATGHVLRARGHYAASVAH